MNANNQESIDACANHYGEHAAAMRENPLQIVGFRGFTTYVYDTDTVQYPGNLANCTACHTSDGYTLPVAAGVQGTTIDTGEDHMSPLDDMVVTPETAACASCHDDDVAAAHMTSNGGSFSTTQEAIDSGEVVEQCSVCHGSGNTADVSVVHGLQ